MYFDTIQWRDGEISAHALSDIQMSTAARCSAILPLHRATEELCFSHITALQLLGIEIPILRNHMAQSHHPTNQNSSSSLPLSPVPSRSRADSMKTSFTPAFRNRKKDPLYRVPLFTLGTTPTRSRPHWNSFIVLNPLLPGSRWQPISLRTN